VPALAILAVTTKLTKFSASASPTHCRRGYCTGAHETSLACKTRSISAWKYGLSSISDEKTTPGTLPWPCYTHQSSSCCRSQGYPRQATGASVCCVWRTQTNPLD